MFDKVTAKPGDSTEWHIFRIVKRKITRDAFVVIAENQEMARKLAAPSAQVVYAAPTATESEILECEDLGPSTGKTYLAPAK